MSPSPRRTCRAAYARAVADRMAAHAARRARSNLQCLNTCRAPASSFGAAAVVRRAATSAPVAVVIASDSLTGELASSARRIQDADQDYTPASRVAPAALRRVSLVLPDDDADDPVGATWMGLYLAKRITEPVQRLATAAREIEAGHLDYRVDRETVSDDEFGSLVEAFNSMATEVGKSRRRLERSTVDLDANTSRWKAAAGTSRRSSSGSPPALCRSTPREKSARSTARPCACSDLPRRRLDSPPRKCLAATIFSPSGRCFAPRPAGRTEPSAQEIPLTRDDRELQLAAVATALRGTEGSDGLVLVVDDVSPLIRAQKVAAWREVARRLAHEIKNPLTPIQLCAERIRRHFSSSPEPTLALVEECTSTIVGEVDSLKALVDEFSQFARMPAPRAVPTDLHALLNEALALYQGLLGDVRFERRFAEKLPKVRVDGEQVRRVVINLVDNAIEAMNRSGVITLETQHDPGASLVRLIVTDDGPGIPPAEREKLFMPYYSTKRRGSGLGLAIVRRIVAEHGGTIEAGDNEPRGTKFIIELPC